jgi:hypothetical protein
MFGVRISFPPNGEQSAQLKSSAMKKTTLGRSAAGASETDNVTVMAAIMVRMEYLNEMMC